MKYWAVHITLDDHYQTTADDPTPARADIFGLLYFESTTEAHVAYWLSNSDFTSHNTDIIVLKKVKGMKIRRLRLITIN
jgi:hypothetical protein